MFRRFFLIGFFLLVCMFQCCFAGELIDQAKELAVQGKYQQAYELLLQRVQELDKELANMQGVLAHYKKETAKLKGDRPEVIDHDYNKAANRLWTSAWRLQHDGVFKETGQEKEESLEKSIAIYKRIVIDYPYADKAEEAQYRIGRVYYKFLKDKELAEKELQRYLDIYPNGKYASDARSMLTRIRGK